MEPDLADEGLPIEGTRPLVPSLYRILVVEAGLRFWQEVDALTDQALDDLPGVGPSTVRLIRSYSEHARRWAREQEAEHAGRRP
jgi:hypothetical protein